MVDRTPDGMRTRARAVLAKASPQARRWRRFLAGLDFDPDAATGPLQEPSARDFIVCGPPRTGTTLLCAALHQPPRAIAVMEPWDGMRIPPADLFASLRAEVADTGRLSRGKLDNDRLRASGDVAWTSEGAGGVERLHADDVAAGYVLGVKWPAFWRYLDRLPQTKFVVCLRHPYEVVASYARVGGRLAQGLEYDTAFNRAMNQHLAAATQDLDDRRALLLQYILERILPHLDRPNVFVVRYERWFDDPEQLLRELGEFVGVELDATSVRLRPPSSDPRLPARQRAAVQRHCRAAAAVGYELA